MKPLKFALGLLLIAACGGEGHGWQDRNGFPVVDPNRCPTQEYGIAWEMINFLDSGKLIMKSGGVCTSSGTYSCNPASKSIELNVTAVENVADHLKAECVPAGKYACQYSYETDDRGFVRLLVDCGSDGFTLYDTARFE